MHCTMHAMLSIHIALSVHPDQSRAEALSRRPLRKLMLRVDDLCRVYACCIIASWQPGFSPKKAMPIDLKASLIISIGSEIGLPLVPSWQEESAAFQRVTSVGKHHHLA